MKIRVQIVLAAIAFFVVMGLLVALYFYTDNRVDTSTIDYIKGMMKGKNEFLDLANDINVESVDDVGFVVRGRYKIDIHYGDQVIEMNSNCFEDEDYRKALSGIGIEVKSRLNDDDTVQYLVTYWGEKCEQWSKVD